MSLSEELHSRGALAGQSPPNKVPGWYHTPCLRGPKFQLPKDSNKASTTQQQGNPDMTTDTQADTNTKPKTSSHVRFTDQQLARIQRHSKTTGESIPDLLKRAYFSREHPQPLLNKDDADRILTALARIGNNINQIARHLNAGFREGFQGGLAQAFNDLARLRSFAGGFDGTH